MNLCTLAPKKNQGNTHSKRAVLSLWVYDVKASPKKERQGRHSDKDTGHIPTSWVYKRTHSSLHKDAVNTEHAEPLHT
jgi:hypothetical protein